MKIRKVLSVLMVLCVSLTLIACQKNKPEETKITVTFRVDGNIQYTQKVTAGSLVVAPKEPTKKDLVFSGWFTQENGGVKWNFLVNTVSEDGSRKK